MLLLFVYLLWLVSALLLAWLLAKKIQRNVAVDFRLYESFYMFRWLNLVPGLGYFMIRAYWHAIVNFSGALLLFCVVYAYRFPLYYLFICVCLVSYLSQISFLSCVEFWRTAKNGSRDTLGASSSGRDPDAL